jgi:phosphoribosylformylglycinamidine (FGAM) synthase PurS component
MEISYEDILKANETIITTNIKGKEYAEVNQRIKAFRMLFPTGTISTELISNQDGICIFRAIIATSDGTVLGTGTAYEKENSSFINKTSYIENCETSAVGRALGMAGFGIDTSVRSAEETLNAELQQGAEKTIAKTMVEALNKSIENANIKDEVVEKILKKYGYENTKEIKMKDYMNIINDFKSEKGAKDEK